MPGKKYKWTKQQEDDLIDLYEPEVYMYDMQHASYQDTTKKNDFEKKVAMKLKVPVAQVHTRWRSFRTDQGRYLRAARTSRSGSGAPKLSKRKKWIVQRLAFLNKHVKTKETRSSLPEPQPSTSQTNMEEDTAVEDAEEGHSMEEEPDEVEQEGSDSEVSESVQNRRVDNEMSDHGDEETSEEEEDTEERAEKSEDGNEKDIGANMEKVGSKEEQNTSKKDTDVKAASNQQADKSKRPLEVWEEDLLPVSSTSSSMGKTKNSSVARSKPVSEKNKKNATKKEVVTQPQTPMTPLKFDVRDLESSPSEPRSPTPPATPKLIREKEDTASTTSPSSKTDLPKPTPGPSTGGSMMLSGNQTIDAYLKPSALKTKKALKTLRDFKALVGDDIVDDAPSVHQPPGKRHKPPPANTSSAKKDLKGVKKSTINALPKTTLSQQQAKVTKTVPKTGKEPTEERLNDLEKDSDRRMDVIYKIADSWSGMGKRLSETTVHTEQRSASVTSAFSDEEQFWSGFMVTKLRRIEDKQVKDDVMVHCEQVINQAIKGIWHPGMEAAAIPGKESSAATSVPKVIQTPKQPLPGNSSSASRGVTSYMNMLSTPPRSVQNYEQQGQYSQLQNVGRQDQMNIQNQISSATSSTGSYYGQQWLPGSPSIAPQVYCHNYYGNVPHNDNLGGQI